MRNGNGGVEGELGKIRELLRMAALQTAANAKERREDAKQFREELKRTRDEHNREMREIRVLFKQMIRRIAV